MTFFAFLYCLDTKCSDQKSSHRPQFEFATITWENKFTKSFDGEKWSHPPVMTILSSSCFPRKGKRRFCVHLQMRYRVLIAESSISHFSFVNIDWHRETQITSLSGIVVDCCWCRLLRTNMVTGWAVCSQWDRANSLIHSMMFAFCVKIRAPNQWSVKYFAFRVAHTKKTNMHTMCKDHSGP